MLALDVLLIDDERRVRNHLKNTLLECGGVNIVGEADDIPSARALIAAHPHIDGIFLDIQLPGGTGFDIVPDIPDMQKVVFVTAYDQFALRAFEVNALDYVMKPASPERLEQSLKRLRAHKQARLDDSSLESPPITQEQPSPASSSTSRLEVHPVGNAPSEQKAGLLVMGEGLAGTLLQEHDQLLLKFGAKSKFCAVKDIVFVRSADNYTEVYCTDGAIALMRKTLEEWAISLPSGVFVRIHRSSLINIRTIAEMEQDGGGRLRVRLREVEEAFTVSRNYAIALKEALARLAG
ncbi:MAG: DNA-binding response regulator [Candidatus Kapaibacterium sp.]|nr:MAG: DNA-binding response regulator [Candidatus Kapabacteria bacterium]